MVIAIAVGIFGVSTVMTSYSILTREISRNYMNTNPASATLEVDKVDNKLIEDIRKQPGIKDAEAGSIISARIEKKPGKWSPILLFVVKDFDAMRMNKFTRESGAWPPPKGSILLERNSLSMLNAKTGSKFNVQTPSGTSQMVSVSGVVHDPGLAPSWMEQTAYGYITVETQNLLSEGLALRNVKIMTGEPSNDLAIDKTVTGLTAWLTQQGYEVGEIRIPPSGKHPHESQMAGILSMLLIFSVMALALGAILTSTMISGILAQQVRQIGVIKAIGGRSSQIVVLYGSLVFLISMASFAIGLPLGILAGRAFAGVISSLLNFTLYSKAVPIWAYLLQFAVGISTPLLAALYPILKISRTTVREAINDFGVSRKMFGSGKFDKLLSGAFGNLFKNTKDGSGSGSHLDSLRMPGLSENAVMALRNTFRRKGRLLFTLALLIAAGSMFATSLNVKTAWEEYVRSAASVRQYDMEFRFNRLEPTNKVFSIINNIEGVRKIESWSTAPAALSRPDNLIVVRTYPDGGHGSFTIRSYPAGSKMLNTQLASGRKLNGEESGVALLNNMTKMFLPDAKVGDKITLMVNNRNVSLRVVGLTREILTQPTVYVSTGTFNSLTKTGQAERTNVVRIVTYKHDNASRNQIAAKIEKALEGNSVSVRAIVTEEMLDGAITGHVYIFVFALLLMAAIMAVVGVLGLTSTMSTNVIERTREFGVMRTIGGKSKTVLHNVIFEGAFIGLMSWVVAIALSLPLSLLVGNFLGNMAFRSALPLILSPTGVLVWFAIITAGSVLASGFPAKKASRLTVRETLAYI